MILHLSGDQIDRYLARSLSPAEVLALHEHSENCLECRAALGEAALAHMRCEGALLLSEAVDPHLAEDEMVAFVARRLTESRHAQAARHVAECELCADSVDAMESVRDGELRGQMYRSRLPWLAVAGAMAAALLVAAVVFFGNGHGNGHPSGPPQPAMVAALRDAGGSIELDARGNVRGLNSASPEERDLVRQTLERGSLPAARVPALIEAPGVLLGPGSAAPLFAPLGPLNARMLTDRPRFTWQPYPGAERYQVLVTNQDLEPLARSGMITSTEWQPETALPRGVILLWQVRAWKGGEMVSAPAPPAPPATFELADEQTAARIQQLRSGPQPSHLLAAILCAQAGLHEDAAEELQALARENPDSKLVGSLESAAGQ